MGAEWFYTEQDAPNPREAFREAVEDAQYEHGHGGYTGTIAEKSGFRVITPPAGKSAREYAYELEERDDPRCEKWEPAVCMKVKEGRYLFCGWASS